MKPTSEGVKDKWGHYRFRVREAAFVLLNATIQAFVEHLQMAFRVVHVLL